MCGGGGDASAEARRQEAERKRQVEQATRAIDRAYQGRDVQLQDFVDALRGEFRAEAEKQKEVADRQLKFSLARGGLTGGSAAADAGTRLGEEFTKGLLQGEREAQDALAQLKAADEASRSDLIRLAQGGADVTTAASQAARALQSNLEGAKASSLVTGVGDIFSRTRDLYTRQQEAAARRRGLRESELFADPFSRGS